MIETIILATFLGNVPRAEKVYHPENQTDTEIPFPLPEKNHPALHESKVAVIPSRLNLYGFWSKEKWSDEKDRFYKSPLITNLYLYLDRYRK